MLVCIKNINLIIYYTWLPLQHKQLIMNKLYILYFSTA